MRSPFRLLVPVFLVACGVVFFLDEMGMTGVGWIANVFWPALLVGFGLEAWGDGRRVWAGALLAWGGLLWLDNFGYLHWRLERFWPLGLIAAGVAMVVRQEDVGR